MSERRLIDESQRSIAELTALVDELTEHTNDLKAEIARLIETMLDEQSARRYK